MKISKAALAGGVLAALCASNALAQGFNEAAVIDQFYSKRTAQRTPSGSEQWIQPKNKTEKCAVVWSGAEVPTRAKWFGDCRNGKAFGIGITVMQLNAPERTLVAVEEYTGPTKADAVTYRQVSTGPVINIMTGHAKSQDDSATQQLTISKTAAGNRVLAHQRLLCKDGECVGRSMDPMSGSTTYMLAAGTDYQVIWADIRIDNQPQIGRRTLAINNAVRADKYIVDGVPYDIGTDILSGASGRVAFGTGLNTILAMPFERYAEASSEIDAAIRLSDQKFAVAQQRFCGKVIDADVQRVCDPSSLVPSDSELAAGKAESQESVRVALQNLRANAASSNAAIAQARQVQEEMRRQEEQARLVQERESREALQRGFQALSQAGQAAQQYGQQIINQSGGYQTPQVQSPTLSRPPVAHCRTIGYITTCN